MAKDPAILFYTSDFLSGTMAMPFEQRGEYITLLCVMHQSGRLTENQIKNVIRTDVIHTELRSKFKIDETGRWYNERLETESAKRKAYSESRRQSRLKADEDSVRIYLIKDLDSGYFKIGSSVNPMRRFAEMCNQKKPAITIGNRNYELYWISDIVKRTQESELHKKFSEKNITGEWFNLSQSDIKQITTALKGTLQRTTQRTENEIENEVVIEKKIVKSKLEIFELIFTDDIFIGDLSITHRGKDLKQAFEECYTHHSNAPNPPRELWEWRQKLNTWLTIKSNGKRTNNNESGQSISDLVNAGFGNIKGAKG